MKKTWWVMRVMLFYAGLIPMTAFFGLLSPLLWPLPGSLQYFIITRWSHCFIAWTAWILGIRAVITGTVPKDLGSLIVASNHQSAFETVFMQTCLPTQSWVLKRELLWIPFFGWGLALLKPIAIHRQKRGTYEQVMTQGQARLAEGRWVVIFPEGTRVFPGQHKPYAKGAAGLALRSGKPILPIAHNAGHCWPRGWWIRSPGLIHFSVGPVLYPQAGETPEALTQRLESQIREQLARLPSTEKNGAVLRL